MERKILGKTQNLREFFRVKLKIPVYVRKIYYDKEKNLYFYKDWIKCFSKDISGNGIFIYKNDKLNLQKDDFLLIKYDLNNTGIYIYIIAKVVRVTEIGYALTYILIDDNKVDEIVREFLRLDYEKHFKNQQESI